MRDREIDEVWAQLNAMAADKQSWRRYRVLEICCRNCGELIAEVMESAHGPVVVYRSFKGVTAGAAATGKYASQSMSKHALRMLTGGGPFICFCGCSRTILNEADLTAPIEKGQRRVVWRHTVTGLDK
jgi:hypothetical protein